MESTSIKSSTSSADTSAADGANNDVIRAPSACPFSGVAIDPAMWESFQAKLASNNHNNRHRDYKALVEAAELESDEDEDDGGQNSVATSLSPTRSLSPPRPFLRRSKTNNYRVRVINQTTKRSKDIVVDQSGRDKCFNAIYDHPSVKEAHVRKWGAEIADQVKQGLSEIKVKVSVGDDAFYCWFTVEELKEITTKDLYQMIQAHVHQTFQSIVVNLVCVPKGPALNQGDEEQKKPEAVELPTNQRETSAKNFESEKKEELLPSSSSVCGATTSNFRIRVLNQTTKRSKDMVLDKTSQENLFDAVYNNSSVKASHIRKWGSEIAKEVKSGQSEIKVSIEGGKDDFSCWFTVEELKATTIQELYQMTAHLETADSLVFSLVCVPKLESDKRAVEAVPADNHTTASSLRMATGEQQDPSQPQLCKSSEPTTQPSISHAGPTLMRASTTGNFRVRVVNCTTKRSKDMVLDKNGSDSLFDAIYDNTSVKAAHVRKWGSEIAKEVKSGQSEIKVKIEGGKDAFTHWFTVDELKKMTTQELYQMTADLEIADSLVFSLVCVPKAQSDTSEVEAAPADNLTAASSLTIATGEQQDSSSQQQLCESSDPTTHPSVSHAGPTLMRTSTTGNFRVRVVNLTTKRSKDMVLDKNGNASLFDAIYNNTSVKAAHVRKWGSEIAKEVKSGQSDIKVKIEGGEDDFSRWFTVEELKETTTQELYQLTADIEIADSLVFSLVCVPNLECEINEAEAVTADNLTTTSSLTMATGEQQASPSQPQLCKPSEPTVQPTPSHALPTLMRASTTGNFRVHVVNLTTKRSKDMVLHKSCSTNLFDAIYNNPSVKAAHVRKWGSEIAKEVKSGQSEIKVKIEAEEGDFIRWYTVDELKETTTQELYQMMENIASCDSLIFNVVCVPKSESVTNEGGATSSDNFTTESSITMATGEQGEQQEPLSQPQLRELSEPAPQPTPALAPSTLMRTSTTGNFRVHVVNMTTKRSKDMVLDKNCSANLFDAIYNNPSVKAAQVRKWGSEIAKDVKSGHSEIQVKIEGAEDDFIRWFTVEELKETTTQELSQMLENTGSCDSLIFKLVCVPNDGECGTAEVQESEPKDMRRGEDVPQSKTSLSVQFSLKEPCGQEANAAATGKEESEEQTLLDAPFEPVTGIGGSLAPAALPEASFTSNFRVRVVNLTTNRSKDMVLEKNDSTNLFDAIYNNPSVKAAHVRKWGSEIAKEVKSGQSEIKVRIDSGEDGCNRWLTVEELKQLSAQEMHQMKKDLGASDPLVFNLVCVPKGEPAKEITLDDSFKESTDAKQHRRRSSIPLSSLVSGDGNDDSLPGAILKAVSVGTSSQFDSTMSDPSLSVSMMDVDFREPLQNLARVDKMKTTLGVRVINQVTKRHKDLVVHISDSNTVFDMVYDHPGVKNAHVRKWGGPIARAVKQGASEIMFSVWDDDTQKPWRVFSIEELKTTTTRQLYELVSESSNLIKIYLQCVSKADKDSSPNPKSASKSSALADTAGTSMKTDDDSSGVKAELGNTSAPVGGERTERVDNDSKPTPGETRAKKVDSDSKSTTGEARAKKVDSDSKPTPGETAMPQGQAPSIGKIGPQRQGSLRLGKTGRPLRPVHSRPRRQASLRLEKDGRPQFSIQTSRPLSQVFSPVQPVKKPRPNHMKWLAHMPRNGSCPAVQQEGVMSKRGGMQRCVGSHDRLEGGPPTRPQALAHSKSVCSTRDMLRQALKTRDQTSGPLASSLKTREQPVKKTQTLAGSKNESSKNATWQSKKPTGQHGMADKNRLLSSLKQSLPANIQGEAQSLAPKKEEADKALENKTPPLRRSSTIETPNAARRSPKPSAETNARRSRRRRNHRNSFVGLENPGGTLDASEASPYDESIIKPTFKRSGSDPSSLSSMIGKANFDEEKQKKLKEFMRLLRTKKQPEFQSQRSLVKNKRSSDSVVDFDNNDSVKSIPSVVQMGGSNRSPLRSNVSALTLQDKESVCGPWQKRKSVASASACSGSSSVQTSQDKIKRFLRLNQSKPESKAKTNDKIARFLALQKPTSDKEEGASRRLSWGEPDDMDRSMSISTRKSIPNQFGLGRSPLVDMPPLKEISVIATEDHEPLAPISVPGVAMSPEVVKEVFPYHVIFDVDFRIIQVGNKLELLVQESGLVGRYVSDIMTVTSPFPIFGSWDWKTLDKMKDKTIFLDSVQSPAMDEPVKLKGTLIELSKTSKQVMLALFPNVKNLAELEDANLSMADLPLHSCQREAVLLGEHSKSEVNLTNHLDKLHRDLIDSMEQQIKERTEELAAANHQLETANSRLAIQSARQLEHFACMSHEIRTPLNCIVGMSSLLLDDADEMDPLHSDSIRMINTSGDLLKAVVDDVLDYAKLESGSFEVDIKESDLQHTLNSVAHSIAQKVQDKNIRLRLDYSPFLPETVETDSRRLQQVLFNLLGNAGKFSKRDSVIDLTVSVVPVAQTDVDPEETDKGEVIRFSVKDYGKGIEEKDFKTIFEPFSQASKETQNVYGGTGLGLSITSKLVHRLGGTVSLKSEYGRYTDFTVDLPLRGKEVDVPRLQKRLHNTILVLVEPPVTYDYSFTEYAIKPEPGPFQASVAEAYNLNVLRCNGIDEGLESLKRANLVDPTKHFAFLVHEDLFQLALFDRLDKLLSRLNYTLMTFGPKYSVEMTKDRHFKSLAGVFPSAMLEKVVETMERRKLEKMECPEKDAMATGAKEEPGNEEFQTARSPSAGLFAGLQSKPDEVSGGLFPILSSPPSCQSNDGEKSGNHAAIGGQGGLFPIASQSTPASTAATSSESSAQRRKSIMSKASGDKNMVGKQQTHSSARQALKVLYAEDNKINQKVLTRVLARAGITNLSIVDNGKEAVDITEDQKFDIIFMDVQMPIMGGIEATKLIIERNPSERVVFVSAHALDEYKAQAVAVGGTSFLAKPVRPNDIEKLLEEFGYPNSPPASESKAERGTLGIKGARLETGAGNKGTAVSSIATKIGAIESENSLENKVAPLFSIARKVDPRALGASKVEEGAEKKVAPLFSIARKVDLAAVGASKVEEGADKKVAPLFSIATKKVPPSVETSKCQDSSEEKVAPLFSIAAKKVPPVVETSKGQDSSGNTVAPLFSIAKETDPQTARAKKVEDSSENKAAPLFSISTKIDPPTASANSVEDGTDKKVAPLFSIATLIQPPTKGANSVEDSLKSKVAPLFSIAPNIDPHKVEGNITENDAQKKGAALFSIANKIDQPRIEAPQKESTVSHVQPAMQTQKPAQQSGATSRQALKVLYAEDNKINQKVLSRVLAKVGIKNVTIVENGREAVDVTEHQKFDVIFMDMQMPIMGGMEATKLITDRNPSEKVVFVTAHTLDEFKTQADEVGATSYLSKPFKPGDVEKLLEDLGYSNAPLLAEANSKSTAGQKEEARNQTPGENKTGGLFSLIPKNDSSLVAQPRKEELALKSNAQAPVKKTTAKQDKHSAARKALKVLYAEDNKVNQKVMTRVLTRVGIDNLTIVDDGVKAVNIAREQKFDIIFMDIQMPIMGGMEATKLIIESNPSEKVIFVTAHALDEFKEQAHAVGATSFLSKPFQLDDMQNLLKDLGF